MNEPAKAHAKLRVKMTGYAPGSESQMLLRSSFMFDGIPVKRWARDSLAIPRVVAADRALWGGTGKFNQAEDTTIAQKICGRTKSDA
jgi:hypothetical protein